MSALRRAIAHQSWFEVFLKGYERDQGPWMPAPDAITRIQKDQNIEDKKSLITYVKRKSAKEIFREVHNDSSYLRTELINLYVSVCYSCDKFAIWVADTLLYPAQPTSIVPHEDMPSDIRADFDEAASIVDKSPRGAAALVRLCIQKLMVHLGQNGKHIDADIGALVKNGLDTRIQKALDVVRVVGNNAVHPGQIDLKDDKSTATKLFDLVNLIVEAMIATPKHIEKMFGDLPEGARKAIEKRDGDK
jgi:Domain of unknown function (DUF4145)